MKVKLKQKGDETHLLLQGKGSIDGMEELKNILLKVMRSNRVTIDISGLTDPAFSFYQLMLSFINTFRKQEGKELKIYCTRDKDFITGWKNYGFNAALLNQLIVSTE